MQSTNHPFFHNVSGSKFQASGFTLIELLVVVAVVAILAAIVITFVPQTRAKARDADRIQQVQQMMQALEVEAAKAPGGGAILGSPCNTGPVHKVHTCTGGPGVIAFAGFADPKAGTAGVACTNASTTACQYGLSNSAADGAPRTNDYQICFYVEGTVSSIEGLGGDNGPKSIRKSGDAQPITWNDGCN